MNLFENLQVYYEHENTESLYEMAKLTRKNADLNVCGDIPLFIYFSKSNSSHSPRVKFYGGTKEVDSTDLSPSMQFSENGVGDIILQSWMNKKNCPNAFDKQIIEQVGTFVNKFKSLLLLVWFKRLDEDDLLEYFKGRLSWRDLLDCVEINENLKQQFISNNSLGALEKYCKENDLYSF